MKQRVIAAVCALTVVTSCGTGKPTIQIRTLAAVPSAELEPETIPAANLSGPLQVISDSTASSGAYLNLDAVTPPPAPTAGSFYVDSVSGNDSLDGRSPQTAWKSLAKAGAATLVPGQSLLLKRGGSWIGSVTIPWSGVTVSAYGSGSLPLITNGSTAGSIVDIRGSNNTIAALELKATSSANGYLSGFNFSAGAKFNTLVFNKASGLYAGVYLNEGAARNKIIYNQLVKNTMINIGTTDDSGAFGVLVVGSDNEIANNQLDGNVGVSPRYGTDGSAIEIYNGSRNLIHHNRASENRNFTELGVDSNHTVSDNTYAFNLVTSAHQQSDFLITRGAADPGHYGPISNTRVFNNTVYLTSGLSQGVICYGGCSPAILTLKNNIIWADYKTLYSDGHFKEGNNIYWKTGGSPTVVGTIDATSKKTDPLFVAPGSDFHLQSGSPAANTGSGAVVNAGFLADLDGKKVPSGGAVDIGVYELNGSVCSGTPNPASGLAVTTIDLPATDDHSVWSRLKPIDASNDSYYLQIDNRCAIKVGDTNLPATAWTWVNWRDGNQTSPIRLKLPSGVHKVRIFGAEPNVGLDRLILTTDAGCVPSGLGDNCGRRTLEQAPHRAARSLMSARDPVAVEAVGDSSG